MSRTYAVSLRTDTKVLSVRSSTITERDDTFRPLVDDTDTYADSGELTIPPSFYSGNSPNVFYTDNFGFRAARTGTYTIAFDSTNATPSSGLNELTIQVVESGDNTQVVSIGAFIPAVKTRSVSFNVTTANTWYIVTIRIAAVPFGLFVKPTGVTMTFTPPASGTEGTS